MRKILLFMTLGCSILLGACSDVEVGYLVSEHAAYTQDSLHLYNIENRLEELINILNEFYIHSKILYILFINYISDVDII